MDLLVLEEEEEEEEDEEEEKKSKKKREGGKGKDKMNRGSSSSYTVKATAEYEDGVVTAEEDGKRPSRWIMKDDEDDERRSPRR
ncbi:hypothetical protein MGYG_09149 [Nannizzia gypsea CBS 118893]|uniref:Uncharacterized protein n=1 Tax=Arthroderma gypseum (strain ATCC MYA-4604 / CBS 118893) TaxID=535722 RepID=E4V2X3_ARTGP|nr:hypothetical protein MGYG_09149 [Nannizzia gypsea CBS 118893]EFR04347.1 hypothetical protein MGYG_09149 [Nannizzia gypsea CBS 118893]